ncbi:uncharacterized protein [Pocillopora verrucosa]|uniref:uncharacterized protein isoform X3 n=1 Tax=Pocillopora verrucosa TaxID=203993 RepID=UPI00333F8C0D
MSEKVSKKNINIWEAKIVILFTFFFEIVIFLTFYGTSLLFIHGAVNGREIVTIIIILKVDHYVFFSSFFLHLVSEEETRFDKLWGSRFGVPEAKNGDYKSAISAKGQPRRISGLYSVNRRQRGNSTHFRMEHSALNGSKSKWKMEVKFRPKGNDVAKWQNISVYYPGATTEIDHNFINLTIPWPEEEHEFAVFGTPEKEDKKRMQLGIFGENRAKGKNALFHAVFFDDTLMAFKNVCSKEESDGRHLLTTLGGLFVSISDEDIKIEVSGLESGFEWKGSSVKTIKSKDAWNTPENSTDFPYCVFEIKCVDKMKQSFLCEITATHEKDSTKVVVVTPLEQKNEVPFAG